MKKNLHKFYLSLYNYGIFILICFVIFASWYIFFHHDFKGQSFQELPLSYQFGIVGIECIIIVILVSKAYVSPIRKIQKDIANFLSGKNKGKNKDIKISSLNPNIRFIEKFFSGVLIALKDIKDDFVAGREIKSEVQLATELQEKLLNKKIAPIPSLSVISKGKPAGEIGGDSYDTIVGQDNNFYIYVGDATGHGVGAGFVMVMVNALVSGFAKVFKKGNEILAHTNEILKPRIKSNILMTLVLLRWDENQKRLFMTGAGHEYIIIYKHNLKKCFKIKSGGLALGMTQNVHKILKEQEIVKFEKNDIAVLYTDGITESINGNKKDGTQIMFGESRLMEAVSNAPNLPGTDIKTAQGVFNNITIELSKFLGYKHYQGDDITLTVIHYHGGDVIENDFSPEISQDFITEWNWE